MQTKAGLKKKIAAIDAKINELEEERARLADALSEKQRKKQSKLIPILSLLIFAAAAFWIVITISGFTFSDVAELARLEFNKMMGE